MNDTVKEKLKILKLKACADNFDMTMDQAAQQNWPPAVVLDYLLDIELEAKRKNRVERCFKQSKLNEIFTIDQFDFNHHISRKKQKSLITNLTTLEFIKEHKDVIIIGGTGVGKTFLAKSLCYYATLQATKTLFTTAVDMINHMNAAEADGSLLKKLDIYFKPQVLVIDEMGFLPLGANGSNHFFQIVRNRHDTKKSTILTTNLPFSEWGEVFNDTTVATAIADRLTQDSETIVLKGPSYRPKVKKNQ